MAYRFECPLCKKTFRKQSGFEWHWDRFHGNERQRIARKTKGPLSLQEQVLFEMARHTGILQNNVGLAELVRQRYGEGIAEITKKTLGHEQPRRARPLTRKLTRKGK